MSLPRPRTRAGRARGDLPHEHLGGPSSVSGGRRLEQVHGDLLEVPVLAQGGQGLGGTAVNPRAAQDVALFEDRLAHERVREREAVRRRGGSEKLGAQDLVEGALGGVGREPGGGRQRAGVVLKAQGQLHVPNSLLTPLPARHGVARSQQHQNATGVDPRHALRPSKQLGPPGSPNCLRTGGSEPARGSSFPCRGAAGPA